MKVGGFFVLWCVNEDRINRMSNRTPRTLSRECPHRFDTGFIPTADYADDHIIVTRNSPLLSAVSRKRPGEYRISGGSFIGGGGSREATAYEVAEYLARSPHWAHLNAVDPEVGLARCASRLGQIMKRLLPLNLPLMSPSLS